MHSQILKDFVILEMFPKRTSKHINKTHENMDAEKKNAKKTNYVTLNISQEPEFCSKDNMGNNGAGQLNR